MTAVAWLVYHRKFKRARVFFLQKGDTKTGLDQSFGTVISGLKYFAVYTVSMLLYIVQKLLKVYTVRVRHRISPTD